MKRPRFVVMQVVPGDAIGWLVYDLRERNEARLDVTIIVDGRTGTVSGLTYRDACAIAGFLNGRDVGTIPVQDQAPKS